MTHTRLERHDGYWRGSFDAMASPCEVLIDTDSHAHARLALDIAANEAWRIERAFSRYRDDNVIHRINNAGGSPVEVHDETARLLDFAASCYRQSGGAFDVTSGVLRRAWRFDGSDNVPSPAAVAELLPLVGWYRVRWEPPVFAMPAGMEIDLGGIGKEYAVDRCLVMIRERVDAPVLVNFGGDLHASGPPHSRDAWSVGVEAARDAAHAQRRIDLRSGAMATSGDARRYLELDGIRFSHVLDPRTGWPVEGAPRSVTVMAGTCTEAGAMATIALLRGAGAEAFLESQNVEYWCERE